MDCKNCNAEKATRFSDESMSEKLLRIIKWIIIACAIFAVLNNAVWLYVWQLYDYTGDKTVTVDGKEGIAGYVEGDGYSMHGAADKLRELMDEAPDEQTRRELERLAARMDR